MQDHKKLIKKILSWTEKFKQADNTLNLVETKFSRINFEKTSEKELGKLTATAKDLFHFNNEFRKLHNVRNELSVYFLDDQIQKTKPDTVFPLINAGPQISAAPFGSTLK